MPISRVSHLSRWKIHHDFALPSKNFWSFHIFRWRYRQVGFFPPSSWRRKFNGPRIDSQEKNTKCIYFCFTVLLRLSGRSPEKVRWQAKMRLSFFRVPFLWFLLWGKVRNNCHQLPRISRVSPSASFRACNVCHIKVLVWKCMPDRQQGGLQSLVCACHRGVEWIGSPTFLGVCTCGLSQSAVRHLYLCLRVVIAISKECRLAKSN